MEQIQKGSYTFTVKDKNGFDGLYTIRQEDKEGNDEFHNRILRLSFDLKDDGFEPVVKGYAKGGSGFVAKEKDWTGKKCPEDNGRLYRFTTKTGKTMIKCENSKYDFATKTASGCTYYSWEDKEKEY